MHCCHTFRVFWKSAEVHRRALTVPASCPRLATYQIDLFIKLPCSEKVSPSSPSHHQFHRRRRHFHHLSSATVQHRHRELRRRHHQFRRRRHLHHLSSATVIVILPSPSSHSSLQHHRDSSPCIRMASFFRPSTSAGFSFSIFAGRLSTRISAVHFLLQSGLSPVEV